MHQVNSSLDSKNIKVLICYSHLRWNFVFQRPQHLMNRASLYYNTIFLEEPIYEEALQTRICYRKGMEK